MQRCDSRWSPAAIGVKATCTSAFGDPERTFNRDACRQGGDADFGRRRKLVQYARKILQLNDEAYASMSDDVLTGFVRLGVPLDFFGRDFTTWLARFKNKHPMVGLEVEANQSENLMKRSMRGEFDLAFFKQETGARNGIVALREQLVWVSGPNYSGDDNESVPLILFPEGCAYRRFAIAALKDHRRSWHLSFVSPSFECLKSAAVEGMGISSELKEPGIVP